MARRSSAIPNQQPADFLRLPYRLDQRSKGEPLLELRGVREAAPEPVQISTSDMGGSRQSQSEPSLIPSCRADYESKLREALIVTDVIYRHSADRVTAHTIGL